MKTSGLLACLSVCFITQTYAGTPTSACVLVSAKDIQTAFGKAVDISTDTPEICDYTKDSFSIRVMYMDYHDEDAAKKGFKTLFAGKNSIEKLGDEANSHRQGREIDKVSMRQGQRVLSISKMGGEYVEDGLQTLEFLLRQAADKAFSSAASTAVTIDAACEPVLKASEAKLAQAAWHTITESSGFKLEVIKVDGQFFMNNDSQWQQGPDMSHAEKVVIGMMKDGSMALSDCKQEDSTILDGVEVTIISYHTEMKEMGAGTTQLYMGKNDGLPYKSLAKTDKGETSTQTIRYKDVLAPKL